MNDTKIPLVNNRLLKRLKYHGHGDYKAYYDYLQKDKEELQIAVDLLTTNETYFFREQNHFKFINKNIPIWDRNREKFRVWSAASSIGAEAYSIAMTLAEGFRYKEWEILGSDISKRVVERAKLAHYPLEMSEKVPADMLQKYCLKGVNAQKGTFIIKDELKKRVDFMQINLNNTIPDIGKFDLIFLRNVLIYFEDEKKREIVAKIASFLKPDGFLIVGHSETINTMRDLFDQLDITIYKKKRCD